MPCPAGRVKPTQKGLDQLVSVSLAFFFRQYNFKFSCLAMAVTDRCRFTTNFAIETCWSIHQPRLTGLASSYYYASACQQYT